MPRLWAFFGLSQILPISFTQNLFYVALLRSSDRLSRRVVSERMLKILTRLTVAYCCSLIILPRASRSAWLMPMVLVTRLLLFAPLLLSRSNYIQDVDDRAVPQAHQNTTRFKMSIAIPVLACILFQSYIAFKEKMALSAIGTALFEHPAVSTLGCDLIISLISGVTWLQSQPRQREKTS